MSNTLVVTNCSGERSFSKLKRIKNERRSTMRHDRLNHVREIDLTELIDKFAKIKARQSRCRTAVGAVVDRCLIQL